MHLLTILLTLNTFLLFLESPVNTHFTFHFLLSSFNFHSYNIIQFCTKLSLRPLFLLNYHHFHLKPIFIFFSTYIKNSVLNQFRTLLLMPFYNKIQFCTEPLLIYFIYLLGQWSTGPLALT